MENSNCFKDPRTADDGSLTTICMQTAVFTEDHFAVTSPTFVRDEGRVVGKCSAMRRSLVLIVATAEKIASKTNAISSSLHLDRQSTSGALRKKTVQIGSEIATSNSSTSMALTVRPCVRSIIDFPSWVTFLIVPLAPIFMEQRARVVVIGIIWPQGRPTPSAPLHAPQRRSYHLCKF